MASDINSYLSGISLVYMIFIFAGLVLNIAFLYKFWFALVDIKRLRQMVDDMHFRECARYESEKRRGLITADDLDAAEELVKA